MSAEDARALSIELGRVGYVEVSAKMDVRIHECFATLAREIYYATTRKLDVEHPWMYPHR